MESTMRATANHDDKEEEGLEWKRMLLGLEGDEECLEKQFLGISMERKTDLSGEDSTNGQRFLLFSDEHGSM